MRPLPAALCYPIQIPHQTTCYQTLVPLSRGWPSSAIPSEMWAPAGREISAAYRKFGSPLQALAGLDPLVPALKLSA